ncbi:MAG: TPM domain-containing protein [Vicinamibacteria bacterium]
MSESFFSKIDEPRIVEAIRAAELRSRGEIRIHVTEAKVSDAVKEATVAFEKLGMTATAERNGVLIFIASASQKFAVLGDSGITGFVGMNAWSQIATTLGAAFRGSKFTEGLVSAVDQAGSLLAAHYPRFEGVVDADELPNTISRG